MMLKHALSSALLVAASTSRSLAFVVAPRRATAAVRGSHLFLLDNLFSNKAQSSEYPIYADESIMDQKAHGTSATPVQKNLRWNCDYNTADRICNFNRHYAEHAVSALHELFLNFILHDNTTRRPNLLQRTFPAGLLANHGLSQDSQR